jgi:hypothetical protein
MDVIMVERSEKHEWYLEENSSRPTTKRKPQGFVSDSSSRDIITEDGSASIGLIKSLTVNYG